MGDDNGYKAFMLNRIPSLAMIDAKKENSDLTISSIQLEPRDAVPGSVRYYYVVRVHAKNDTLKSITYKGNIALVRENGTWKVDGASPEQ